MSDELKAAIAEVKRVTRVDDEAGQGDRWNGWDFTNQQDAHDPTPVDDAIAAILNAVVCGALVPAPAVPDDVAETLRATTEEMANSVCVPMEIWDRHSNAALAAYAALQAQAAELARKEALEFYADQNHLRLPSEGPWGVNSTDFGKVAREALK